MTEEGEPIKSWTENKACREFEDQLVEYAYGTENSKLSVHASECPSCRAILADLKEICRTSHAFPKAEPPERIWANIRVTLAEEGILRGQEQRRRWFPSLNLAFLPNPVAIASVAALAVAMAVVLHAPNGVHKGITQQAVAQKTTHVTAPAYLSEQSTLALTLREMEENYKAGEAKLDPGVRDIYRKSLNSLDNSIVECLASVRQNPDNALAHDYLYAAYQQKARVLANAVEFEGR